MKNEMNFEDMMHQLPKTLSKITLTTLPVVGSAVIEVLNYFDAIYLEQRLSLIEDKLNELNVLSPFIEQLKDLDEHRYYSFRNNLKFLLTSALPETVDVYIMALIDSIIGESHDMAEEVCEIMRQFNANDIKTLQILNDYIERVEV